MRSILFMIFFLICSVSAEEKENIPNNRDGHCDLCGSRQCIRRVPVVKPTTKKIEKICVHVKYEDEVIPGPSCLCGEHHGDDACGCFWYRLWKPTWAKVITKKSPVSTRVTREVPSYEWVVEERCCQCQ